MSILKNKLWIVKYRPTTFDEYVFVNDEHKRLFVKYKNEGSFPNLLLSGTQGTGKTSIALILQKEFGILDSDFLIVNASDDSGIDYVRDQIKPYVTSFAQGEYKVVLLEEADYLSPNAQGSLRRLIEEHQNDVRFIFTLNYENKIIPALKSRFTVMRFESPEIQTVTENIATILIKEDVDFDLDVLDSIVLAGYPDQRKMIDLVQQQTSANGKLLPFSTKSKTTNDYKTQLPNCLDSGDWEQAASMCRVAIGPEQWDDFYSFMFNYISTHKTFSKEKKMQSLVLVSEHETRLPTSGLPILLASSLFIQICNIEN